MIQLALHKPDWPVFRAFVSALAPKAGALPLGSPSFSILLLKEKDLAEELVVARCTTMWLGMHSACMESPEFSPYRRRDETRVCTLSHGHLFSVVLAKIACDYATGFIKAELQVSLTFSILALQITRTRPRTIQPMLERPPSSRPARFAACAFILPPFTA
jgi:hypothetical protein